MKNTTYVFTISEQIEKTARNRWIHAISKLEKGLKFLFAQSNLAGENSWLHCAGSIKTNL